MGIDQMEFLDEVPLAEMGIVDVSVTVYGIMITILQQQFIWPLRLF